ncbi:MAG TPA: hypothetical protein VHF69_03335, partial [Candidatus Synoicihabitans sp.]|nr:hypothetical protein [Candidatus Synoicihabitans sp.]
DAAEEDRGAEFGEPMEVEYLESGTFQGGEEDASTRGIERGSTCVLMTKLRYERLTTDLAATRAERDLLKQALETFIGASDPKELRGMRELLEQVLPAEEKGKMLGAIDVLIRIAEPRGKFEQ